MKSKKFQFQNVKLREGHFNHSMEGIIKAELVLEVWSMDKETIVKLQDWMKMNQLDYVFNMEQDFVHHTTKVDFYRVEGK